MATEIFIPKMGANIEKVVIGKIFVKKGDTVKKSDILFEIVTDKATFDVEADESGVILQLNCQEGDELKVLTVVGFIGNKNERLSVKSPSTARTSVKATPKAKKLAKKNNINIDKVFLGVKKVIREEDIVKFMKINNSQQNYNLIKLSPTKKSEINNLNQSKNYIYSSVTIQIPTINIKKKVEKLIKKYSIRLSIFQYIYYYSALILTDFPNLNAFYSEEGIKVYKDVNIGIALNIDNGLIVAVIQNSNQLSLEKFLLKYNEIVLRVVKNETTLADLQGGTFTITDLSSYRVLNFMPVINKNQSAILAIGSEYDSCRLKNRKLIYDPKINLTLAFDHRVIDGKYALEFLQKLNNQLLAT